ncbi:hypothetical protein T09_15320 [Trichinella sp. T9]|nr:hypothetical protein T09_15320 [Trichinella sp. T9]
MYECQYCQKHYKDVAALYNHQRMHVLYGIYTKITSRHKNRNYWIIQEEDLTTTLIENNSNGSADENTMPTPSNYDTTNTFGANTYTNYEMTNANSGNATVNGIYEYQEINRGDAVLSTKSNIFQTSQIQETNL